jgi:hypothetical protein
VQGRRGGVGGGVAVGGRVAVGWRRVIGGGGGL